MAKLKKYQTFVFRKGFDSPMNGDHLPKLEGYGISGWLDGSAFEERDAAMKLLFRIADDKILPSEIVEKVQQFTKNKCRP